MADETPDPQIPIIDKLEGKRLKKISPGKGFRKLSTRKPILRMLLKFQKSR